MSSQTTNHATGATSGESMRSPMIINVKMRLTMVLTRGNQMEPKLYSSRDPKPINKSVVMTTEMLFAVELRESLTAPTPTTSTKYMAWRMAE